MNGTPDKDSGLSDLERKLYSRSEEPEATRRARLRPRDIIAPRAWETRGRGARGGGGAARLPRVSLMTLFWASLVFFVLAVGASFFFIFGGTNTISSRNVDIIIDGPTDTAAGDTLPLSVVITNKNAVAMELTDLIVEFPEGTRADNDLSTPLPRLRESLGTIAPGESVNRTVRAVLFGEGLSKKEITVTVEYRIASSNAIFHADARYETRISSSPLSLIVEGAREIIAGEEVPLTIRVRSNAAAVLRNVLLTAEYPFGFSVVDVSPAPIRNENAWRLGDLAPGAERTISLRGTFAGQDGEERVVRFAVGSTEEADATELPVPFATSDASFTLSRPFVSATLALGGSVNDSYVFPRGAEITGDISWVNTLPAPVRDLEIRVALQGDILNRSAVIARQGFYRSSDTTVLFTRETNPLFADVLPGSRGAVSFSFSTLPLSSGGSFKEPEVTLIVTVTGRTTGAASAAETVTSSFTRTIRIATDLALSSRAVRSTGPFANFGPIPPKADEQTSYTVIWTVTNSMNAVANAVVTATAPSYVAWGGAVSPQGKNISYDSTTRVITWKVGDVPAGTSGSTQEVAFQIALTPSVTHVGTAPVILNDARITGADRFTGTTVSSTKPALTTRITTDPAFQLGQDVVVP